MKRLSLTKETEKTFKTYSENLKEYTRNELHNRIVLDCTNITEILHKEIPADDDLEIEFTELNCGYDYTMDFEVDCDNGVIQYETYTLDEIRIALDGNIFLTFVGVDDEKCWDEVDTDYLFGLCQILDETYYHLCRNGK